MFIFVYFYVQTIYNLHMSGFLTYKTCSYKIWISVLNTKGAVFILCLQYDVQNPKVAVLYYICLGMDSVSDWSQCWNVGTFLLLELVHFGFVLFLI